MCPELSEETKIITYSLPTTFILSVSPLSMSIDDSLLEIISDLLMSNIDPSKSISS